MQSHYFVGTDNFGAFLAVLRLWDALSPILIFFHPGSRIKQEQKRGGGKKFKYFEPQNILLSSQKNGLGIRDPGSGKNLSRITDLGVKKASGSRIRNTAF